jgi:DNA replication protein DnaC
MNDDACETRTVTLACPKHGEYTGEAFRLSGWGDCELDPVCPVCKKESEEIARREEAERQKLRWQSMNIKPKFYESTFGNFDAYNGELKRHLAVCRKFAEKPAGKLVMLGENGNGKTHLAVSILKETGGMIYKAFGISVRLHQSYGGDAKEWEVYQELCTTPLLVIDEVEKVKDSEAKQNWMSYVIGERYDLTLPVILIANCHKQKDCAAQNKPCPNCLEYQLENDVLSRIIEDGIILNFSSGDYREKIRSLRTGATA